jgi:streptomycin 6-kinase
MEWLENLPALISELAARWSLDLSEPFDDDDVSCSWVARARLVDGGAAVLKIGMPHMEGLHEIAALRELNGDPTVMLLDADENVNAMLLERCDPGTSLRELFQPDQDVVIAEMLKRFWRPVEEPHPFRPLSMLINDWMEETRNDEPRLHNRDLVTKGLETFETLVETSLSSTLLATDLHAGNVLASRREPWLVIDPKPFIGDPAFDATQHLLNSRSRLRVNPWETIRRVASLLELDYERVRLWTFARLAAEPRDEWDEDATQLAQILVS